MKKQILITGFDPFGGESINPSWEAVKGLEDEIGDYRLVKMEIPTVFKKAAEKIIRCAEEIKPDVILMIGQAGGRRGVTPEVIGINLREARISDNEGNAPQNEPIVENAPAAYFATVPVRRMVQAISSLGIPSALSYSAGAFVCNDVLYSVLHHFRDTKIKAGFIHVPFLPEQAKENAPALPLHEIVRALTAAVSALSE